MVRRKWVLGCAVSAVIFLVFAIAFILWIAYPTDEDRFDRAHSDVANLATALEQFELDVGRYPTTAEGLNVLREAPKGDDAVRWRGPYLKRPAPPDPWGNPYVYVCPGVANPQSYDLLSYGSDGKPGGSGFAEDIISLGPPDAATSEAPAKQQ